MTAPTRAYDLARHLLECAAGGIPRDRAPARQCVVPGASEAWDECCAGQLTVNLLNVYPATSFPGAAIVTDGCQIPYLVAAYNITLLRCVPVAAKVSCDQLTAAAEVIISDAELMMTSIICCLLDKDCLTRLVGAGYRWQLGTLITRGPEGGCHGFTIPVTVGLMTCAECCE